ncbi:MAG: DUF853 family protein [Lachnospiraceae bacterium]|nr:DUF853 family protein [Lachnospiraceae bacterium]
MIIDNKILVGAGDAPVYLLPEMANRHGLIAGATGTGKTVTMKVLAEGLSNLGVPVFMADVKGDVSSMSLAGEKNEKILSRLEKIGVDQENFVPQAFPVRFWDVYGNGGIPVRATVSDIGPMLLSRLLGLTPAQTGVLNIAFRLADDDGLELIDFKDLKTMLTYVGEIRGELTNTYGNVSPQSVGAIQRALLAFEDQGADVFLGEPDFQIEDWFQRDEAGRGYVNILHCAKLAQNPLLYSTFMLWMLSELYENLPEVGDLEKPKLAFFFDEAHMLFKDAPKALLDKITQVVKLIRSKGVGIYFITQSPSDIPDEVLAQLNNRIQHALHAYTPAEQKAVKVAAMSFRPNSAFKTEEALSNLGTGEALVSMLGENGAPQVVEKATIAPPQCSFTALTGAARAMVVCEDPLYPKYKDAVDNRSAYEILNEIAEEAAAQIQEQELEEARRKQEELQRKEAEKKAKEEARAEAKAAREWEQERKRLEREAREMEKERQAQYKAEGRDKYGRTKLQQSLERAAKRTVKSQARSVGRNTAKRIARGLLGNSNKTAERLAGNFASSVMGDLVDSCFGRR